MDTAQPAERWQEGDSEAFLEDADVFVPERDLQQELVCSLLPDTVADGHILDLCCGEGRLSRAILERFPDAIVHGLDASPVMLARAREDLAAFGERFLPERFELADRSWRSPTYPVHAFVSSLAIHHLDGPEKRTLFRDMGRVLAPGGVVVLVDLVRHTEERSQKLAARMWEGAVRRQAEALGRPEAFRRFVEGNWNMYALEQPDPADRPSPLVDQLIWLRDGGLVDVDVYWMLAGHAIFGGRRAG